MDSAAPDSRGRGGMQMQAGPEPHHANMQGLINLLQENRPLSVMEYDRLIRYLSDRRDRQMAEDARGGGGLAGSQPAYLLGNVAKKKNNIFLCCLNNNQLINYWNCFVFHVRRRIQFWWSCSGRRWRWWSRQSDGVAAEDTEHFEFERGRSWGWHCGRRSSPRPRSGSASQLFCVELVMERGR